MTRRDFGNGCWGHRLKRFCEVWLIASNRALKTVAAYRTDLMQFIRHWRASTNKVRITRHTVEKWVASLQEGRYEASSIRRKLASLRAFFSYLLITGEIRKSPLTGLRLQLGSTKRLTRIVERRDVRAIIAKADQQLMPRRLSYLTTRERLLRYRNAIIVRLLCVTGIRVGELVTLNTNGFRHGERAFIVHGKGSRERLAFVADTPTAVLLRKYVTIRNAVFPETTPLFTNFTGRALTTESIRHILQDLGKAADIQTRITPHMLRHTAASTLLENGADLRIVQEFLGHASIRSTERYTHIARRHFERVLRRTNPLKLVA